MQDVLWREVINPQNGHMRCNPEFPLGGVFPRSFLTAWVINANNARIWTGNGFTDTTVRLSADTLLKNAASSVEA